MEYSIFLVLKYRHCYHIIKMRNTFFFLIILFGLRFFLLVNSTRKECDRLSRFKFYNIFFYMSCVFFCFCAYFSRFSEELRPMKNTRRDDSHLARHPTIIFIAVRDCELAKSEKKGAD